MRLRVFQLAAFVLAFFTSLQVFAAAPTATTTAASNLTTSSAQLNGTGTPNGEQTTGWFRISQTNPGSCDDVFGTRVPAAGGTDLGSGAVSVPYSINATGLTSGSTYYFCAIVQNASGMAFGTILSFTVPGAPVVTTNAATSITSSGATLNGSANPNSASATGWFRYDTTNPGSCNDAFGLRAPVSGGTALGSGTTAVDYARAITGLTPGATYYYCAIAQNGNGTSFGAVQSFTALANAPIVTTNSATLVTGTTAQLNGAANPGGAATTGWFRYSTTNPGTCNDVFGSRAPAAGGSSLGTGNNSVAYALGITGLTPATTYYFCALAQNSVGLQWGSVLQFTTPAPPTVSTSAATSITNSTAYLEGYGTPNGATTTGYFRYSLTDPGACNDVFGSRAPVSGGSGLGSGTSSVFYNQQITGLSAGTTYYYCAIANNAEGTGYGTVLSFTTASAPVATTSAATLVTSTTATLNGTGDPNGNGAYGYYRYATTDPGSCSDAFGTRAPASSASDTYLGTGSSAVAYSRAISSLLPATTYYYCAIVYNSYGTSYGSVMSFTTLANPPAVTTNSATSLTGTTATLNGTVNPGGSSSTGWFRYATASPGTCNDSFGTRAPAAGGSSLGNGNSNVAYSQGITGLTAGVTYYFCAIAQNAVGMSFGAVVSFTTPLPPTVTTNAASSITNTTAYLSGTGIPNGSATTGYFRYSATNPGACDDLFGSRAPAAGGTALGSGYSASNFSQQITGLSAGTTYYYCAIVNSFEGTAFGAIVSFTTATTPVATTNAATAITSSTATLNGAGDPNGDPAYGYYRYATTNPGSCSDAFGTRAPPSSPSDTYLGAGTADVAYARGITGLTPGTIYYYCAIVYNSYGTSYGQIQSFTTLANAPVVTTNSASLLTSSTATLNGTANPGGSSTTGWFRYSTTSPGTCNDVFGTRAPAAGGSALGAGGSNVAFSQAITGLSAATTYYVCAIAQNAVGMSFGTVVSFTTPTPPTVTTNAASSITSTTATLNGTANPNGSATTGWFRYALTDPGTCDDVFGSRAPLAGGSSLGSGASNVNYSQGITGLSAGTTYYYCAIAQSSEGIAFGSILTFTTPTVPTATTAAATLITSTTVTLNGSGNPKGDTAYGYFRYATSNPGLCNDLFGTRAPASSASDSPLGAGSSSVAYTRALTGLTPATTYYYCALVRNTYGTAVGTVMSFTTLPNLPVVTTNSATALTGTTATLNGSANPGGAATTGWFRYATASPGTCNDSFGTRAPAAGGSSLGTGNANVAYSQAISGLTAGTTYYFCAIASNSAGTAFGAVQQFTTPLPPVVATTGQSSVTNTSAYLEGVAIPNGAATTGYFRYSLTDPGTCDDVFGSRAPAAGGTALGSGYSNVNFSQQVTGLSPGTTYYFCALAQSSEGTAFGAILSFTTPTAPAVTTNAATLVTATTATLNGAGNPKGNGAYGYYRYASTNPGSCSDAFGTRAPASSASDTYLGTGSSDVAYTRGITGLTPGTTYYFCAIVYNSYGTSYGQLLSFTTLANAPAVTTTAATALTGTTATLNGTVNPGGATATGWFRYATASPGSCNDNFGTRAPAAGGSALGNGNANVNYSQAITGLTAGTTYYFCAIAQNAVGMAFGTVLQFTTPLPPTVTTTAVSSLTNTTATLNGSANPNGSATTGYFRYSLTDPGACDDAFGSRAPAAGGTALGNGSSVVSFSQGITGLSPGTTYYYCAIANSFEGTAFGAILSFTTPTTPVATTNAATLITSSSATLNGAGDPNGNGAYGYFRYATSNPGVCSDAFGTRAPASSASDTYLGAGTTDVAYSRGIASLTPGTTYYYCAIVYNSYGTSYGQIQSFTTLATAPTVTTTAASAITTTTATLNGTANPNGAATTGWFRYATASPGTCNDSFGTRAPAAGGSSLGSGVTNVNYSQGITGLTPGTTYYYCAIVSNAVGTAFGSVLSFTTTAPPTVNTLAATPVTATTATLNGTVNPNGFTTTGWFRYSTTNPGTCDQVFGTATAAQNLGAGTSAVAMSQALTSLTPAQTYYFCAIAQSSIGTTLGAVLSFTTPAAPPSVTTVAATLVTNNSATLNATVNPNGGDSIGWFRYATTNPGTCNDAFGTRVPGSGGTALGTGNTPVNFSIPISSLANGTTYYFCALASSPVGTSVGTILSFTTANAPTVTTTAANAITSTGATLNGSANPNLDAATGWFRYDTTNPVTCNDAFGTRAPAAGGTSLGAGGTAVAYSQAITGLTPATTYYFCAIASNSVGTSFGSVMSFTTAATPTVTTVAASGITSNQATLNGSANPNLLTATGWFRYSTTDPGSCNDAFGTRAPAAGGSALGSGNTAVNYAQTITGLAASTTYYYCAIASNAAGTGFGAVMSFTTAGPPQVITSAATLVASTTATLNGSANPNLAAATGWFRYSTTNPGSCNDAFGTRAPAAGGTSLGAGSSQVPYSQAVTGLTAGATYYFCAIASNSGGTAFGTVLTFTTLAAPVVTTTAATSVTSTTATLNGTANPKLDAATGWFRYSTTNPGSCSDAFGTRAPAAGGVSLGAGSTAIPYSQAITGLTAGTTYYYCAIASNSIGTGLGTLLSFTTTAAPVVTTNAASAVASTTATLNGSANPKLDAATGWFRYDTTNPVNCDDSFGTRAPAAGGANLGSGGSAVAYSQAITGLAPATTYYFCAIASNSNGTAFGSVLSFTTASAPAVTTNAATGVTSTQATLNAAANPNLLTATGWFRYSTTNPGSCSDAFGTRAPAAGGTALGAGNTAVNYAQTITGLAASTTYYYCAIASNSAGTGFGSVLTFTTAGPPQVTTVAAAPVANTTATLNGTANPNLLTATGWFRYSPINPGSCNDAFGTRAPAAGGTALGAGSSQVPYSQNITNLVAGTTYYYCAIASNASGTAFGTVMTFTTTAAPVVATTAATAITSTGATLNGTANPKLSDATGWFRYDTVNPGSCNDVFGTRAPAAGGVSLGAGSTAIPYSQDVVGLAPGTTYYYCAIASNAVGTSFGTVLSFTTTTAPVVTTVAASAITSTGATLNGSANPNLSASIGWFRYSAVDPGTCNDAFGTRAPGAGGTSLGAGNTAVAYSQAIAGLAPSTTYYYCAIAQNTFGTGFGAVMTFTTPAAPTVATVAATAVDVTTATLNGTANPNLAAATGWFRYSAVDPGSCNDAFGTRAPAAGGASLGAGSTPVDYAQAITGLQPGTTYYYCAIAQNSIGTGFGAVMSFTTLAPPAVTTLAASAIGSTTATLNGTANPKLTDATGWFRYDTTDPGACNDSFGTRAPLAGGTSLGAGNSAVPFTQDVTGLTPGTTYYFCAIAQSASGTGFGAVLTFKTPGPPTVTTITATSVLSTAALINGAANPNQGATTGWFRYDTADPGACDDVFGTRAPVAGGASLGSGTSPVAYSQALAGLQPQTTYYYCAIAENPVGKSYGAVMSFTTAGTPVVTTKDATALTSTSATLNGTVNPNLAASTGWFRYDTTDPGACDDVFGTRAPANGGTAIPAGAAEVPFSEDITGLAPGTTYYFCAIAENDGGKSYGEILTLTTAPAAPTVTTSPPTQVKATSAELNGLANPNGDAATGWFRYSQTDPGDCDDSFGIRVPDAAGTDVGNGVAPVAFTEAITGLKPAVKYYYCAIAQNAEGTSFGEVVSFVTGAAPPNVVTDEATDVGAGATLNGTATPNGSTTTGWFRYGDTEPADCDDSYGTRLPDMGGSNLGKGTMPLSFSQPLSPSVLLPNKTYYYCAAASNMAGASFGKVLSFTTDAVPPDVTTNAATVDKGVATLSGTANPKGAQTLGWFRYDSAYPSECNDTFGTRVPDVDGTDVGDGRDPVDFTQPVSALDPGTYYYCAIGSNEAGITYGKIESFVIPETGTTNPEPTQPGDCGCRVGSDRTSSAAALSVVALFLLALGRRRRRAA